MALGWRLLIRGTVVLFYCLFFLGLYGGLHVYFAAPPAIQESREYDAVDGPDYFPVLVVEGDGTLTLRSLARQEYAALSSVAARAWSFYRTPGEGILPHRDRLHFRVETVAAGLQQVEISIGEANGQRTSIYTYQLDRDKVLPRSYTLLAAFGDNFSPMPFLVMITALLIFLVEKFLVRRFLRPAS